MVQDLYVLQLDLQNFLESDLTDPHERNQAKACLKNFSHLLKFADSSYMGGDDVLETLQRLRDEVAKKITVARKIRKVKPKK